MDEIAKPTKPRRRRSAFKRLWFNFVETGFGYPLYASVIAAYLKFVRSTTKVVFEPAHPDKITEGLKPFIVTMWHGQNLMMPFARPKDAEVDILVSRGRDGELIAQTLARLGCGAIRGSGSRRKRKMVEKGSVAAFIAMRRRLDKGVSIGMTADFTKKKARQVSPGVLMLAKSAGVPIIPAAFLTSRRYEMKRTWDRTTFNLPFGRGACVFGDPIRVPADADDAMLEQKRGEVEKALNRATERAYALVDGPHG
jgi:lysophospholipid acyltransferase (LPLAT)-like uncharacterized protein